VRGDEHGGLGRERWLCLGGCPEQMYLVEVSMLRSREEVNIGCDRDVMP